MDDKQHELIKALLKVDEKVNDTKEDIRILKKKNRFLIECIMCLRNYIRDIKIETQGRCSSEEFEPLENLLSQYFDSRNSER